MAAIKISKKTMRQIIPSPLLSTVADIMSASETHASLDNLFLYADAPGDPPEGKSKPVKAQEWLRRINKDSSVVPLKIVGKLIEKYMELESSSSNSFDEQNRNRIIAVLLQCGLKYVTGGRIVGTLAAPTQTLEKRLKELDFASVNEEFERALGNVDTEPKEAVSAASNILESLCKIYIADNGLEVPPKQDIKSLWTVVRKDLGFDPSLLEDRDLQTILSGLIATVEGIGALRTHASSAHGAGKRTYTLEPRHARLAIHAAHTITLFALETWEKRKKIPRKPLRVA